MKKQLLTLSMTVVLALTSLPAISSQAKTTPVKHLPTSITKKTWYRQTSGSEGGFNDKTVFHGNTMRMTFSYGGNADWKLTKLRKSSAKVYYATLHYSKKYSSPVKIKIRSHKKFDIIEKHGVNSRGNYAGNENYGAMIFSTNKKPNVID
ncbi:hypothetical protein [Lactiplantibacillus mudanjiangensis]|uniref:Uncharacterized protein n=1 Tax=Lactiplantibacillus mudanjiangensis TaxID=1296538 RepID=A0A660E590_9LACO|nr:hypothetical protein [Lactiplantibacillus mudanjiangensis]VDG24391.1 hypothetical protein [Lactobacillus zymae] [Lactiplantibacillus mudanjiangensis]VDG28193.1 hypothetical protein [Lactobacillus zymae] [Lactiplantibacillus mudanjiangensis]